MTTRHLLLAAAGALAITGTLAVSGIVSGQSSNDETVFVPVTPCRLVDTRPDGNVGPVVGKVGEDSSVTFTAWATGDADSPCEIPTTATAIATNAVAIQPTAQSYLTLYPGGVDNPGTANLNFVAGQAPTPNSATVPLGDDGSFQVYNRFGEVHVVMDVSGYFQPSSEIGSGGATGPAGPAGPRGATGPAGQNGADGADGDDGARNRLSDDAIAREAWFEDPGAPGTISVGGNPVGIATDGKHVYTTNITAGTVSAIDPAATSVVATIPVGSFPFGIAFDGRHLWVANGGSNSVTVIDPMTNTVVGSPIALGAGANPVGLAAAGGSIYVANRGTGSVGVINATTRTLTTTIPVGSDPYDVVFDGTNVHVSRGDTATGFVVSIDPSTNTKIGADIVTDAESQGMVFDGQYLFVANRTGESLTRIDVNTRTVVDTMALLFQPADVGYDGRHLYLLSNGTGTVETVDPMVMRQVGRPIPVGANPNQIIYDGTNLFVTNFSGNSVTKLLPY